MAESRISRPNDNSLFDATIGFNVCGYSVNISYILIVSQVLLVS